MFTIPFHKTKSRWHDRPIGCLGKHIKISVYMSLPVWDSSRFYHVSTFSSLGKHGFIRWAVSLHAAFFKWLCPTVFAFHVS